VRLICAAEGIRGMYRGYWLSVLGIYAPYSAIWWAVYSTTKQRVMTYLPRGNTLSDMSVEGVCGMLSAVTGAVLTNPLDVVKTRLQVCERESSGHRPTVLNIIRTLWREEGLGALGKGGYARALAVAPHSFIYIVVYERVKQLSFTQQTRREEAK